MPKTPISDGDLEKSFQLERMQEYKLRKCPDTILIERIRQRHPKILTENETLRKKVEKLLEQGELTKANKEFQNYKVAMKEYGKAFVKEQKDLDNIKKIIREVPLLTSMVEEHLHRIVKDRANKPDMSDAEKKMYSVTERELRVYLKEMKALLAERYRINITIAEAVGVGKKTNAIRNKLAKIMHAVEKHKNNFFDALSLAFKKTQAKTRAKTKKLKKSQAARAGKVGKNVNLKSQLPDYVDEFRKQIKKIDHDYLELKTQLAKMLPANNFNPRAPSKFNEYIFAPAIDTMNRIWYNLEAVKLLKKIRSTSDTLDQIRHEGNNLITQTNAEIVSEIEGKVDIEFDQHVKEMLDTVRHVREFRNAISQSINTYLTTSEEKNTALQDKYPELPATNNVLELVTFINDVLQNDKGKYDAQFTTLLKKSLQRIFTDIPYRFDDPATGQMVVFDKKKAMEMVKAGSVSNALESKGTLLRKANLLLNRLETYAEKYEAIYKAEEADAHKISILRREVTHKLTAIKKLAQPHLQQNSINHLLSRLTVQMVVLHQNKIPVAEAESVTAEIRLQLSELNSAIKEAQKTRQAKDISSKEEKSESTSSHNKPLLNPASKQQEVVKMQMYLHQAILTVLMKYPELTNVSEKLSSIAATQNSQGLRSGNVIDGLKAMGMAAREALTVEQSRNSSASTLFSRKNRLRMPGTIKDFLATVSLIVKSNDVNILSNQKKMKEMIATVENYGVAPKPRKSKTSW